MESEFNKKLTLRWENDAELFELFRDQLYTPVIGDILDELGLYHQILPQPIQPLRLADKLIGRAMPALMIDVFGPQKIPFGKLTEALDQLEAGEIYVASGGAMRCAYWGELLTANAKKRDIINRCFPKIRHSLRTLSKYPDDETWIGTVPAYA